MEFIMFKKNKYVYECIIPEIFNNKNTEFLDTSLYKGNLFKQTSELNDLFVEFVSSLEEQKKSLYRYFKTQRFSLNQDLVSDIEKILADLDVRYTKLDDLSYKSHNEFFNHLKNKYS